MDPKKKKDDLFNFALLKEVQLSTGSRAGRQQRNELQQDVSLQLVTATVVNECWQKIYN